MKPLILTSLLILAGCDNDINKSDNTSKINTFQSEALTITIPQQLYAETLFDVGIVFDQPVTHVKGELTGISMDMGKVPLFFKSINQDLKVYSTKVLLGACALPVMQWRLSLTWQENGKTQYFEHTIRVQR
ncbi:MAG: hypothetical protein ACPGSN_04835 [Psychrobium sp.]